MKTKTGACGIRASGMPTEYAEKREEKIQEPEDQGTVISSDQDKQPWSDTKH